MFYQFSGQTVTLLISPDEIYELHVPFSRVMGVATNGQGIVAIIGWNEANSGSALIFDAIRASLIKELRGVYYDLQWLTADTLILSDGRSLFLYPVQDWSPVALHRYSRIPYGPIDIRVSPDKETIGFLKWKGDDRKFVLIDIATQSSKEYKHSSNSLAFFDGATVLVDHGGRISSIERDSEKKTLYIKNTRAVIASGSSGAEDGGVQRIRSLLDDPTCTIDDVGRPVCLDGRVYFSSFVCTSQGKSVSLLSVSADRQSLRVHLQFEEGIIEGLHVDSIRLAPYLRVRANEHRGETIARGWYTVSGESMRYIGDFNLVK
ncbi:MAG TPA: hypothetical protein PLC98_25360 [Anaerolineales bacterium]|nr:hypothetical protein [Anaerolineales bacterium]